MAYLVPSAIDQALWEGTEPMNLPFWAGVFGVIISLLFLVSAVRELRRGKPGHARNAAMIHVALVSMFLPFSLIVMIAYMSR